MRRIKASAKNNCLRPSTSRKRFASIPGYHLQANEIIRISPGDPLDLSSMSLHGLQEGTGSFLRKARNASSLQGGPKKKKRVPDSGSTTNHSPSSTHPFSTDILARPSYLSSGRRLSRSSSLVLARVGWLRKPPYNRKAPPSYFPENSRQVWNPPLAWKSVCCLCLNKQRGMAMSRGSAGDIILQGGRKLDLRDRSLSTQDVTALADLLSTRKTEVSTLILYNVRLNSDVSSRRGSGNRERKTERKQEKERERKCERTTAKC